MKNVYYCYRIQCDRQWNQYSPEYRLADAYPEWTNSLATFNDGKIETSVTTGRRVWWLEVDDTIETDVTTEIQTFGIGSMLWYMTEPEVITYLDANTSYTAVPIAWGFSYIIQEADIPEGIPEIKLSLSST